MNRTITQALFLGAFCTVLLASSWTQAGTSGRYALDKEPLIKRMMERINKLPPERRGFASMAVGMIKGMTMFIDLGQDGKASMSLDMSMFGRRRQQTSIGTWKKGPDALYIDVKAENVRPHARRARPQSLRCEVTGKRIACRNEGGKGRETMYFDKISDVAQVAKPAPLKLPAFPPQSTVGTKTPKPESKPESKPAIKSFTIPTSRPATR